MTRRGWVAAATRAALMVLALLVGLPASANARRTLAGDGQRNATRQEVATLARDAATDPAAVTRLRAVRSIDGQPVDLTIVLAEPGRTARLAALAAAMGEPPTNAAGAGDASRARQQARRILAGPAFHGHPPRRPLRGMLHTLGGWLRPIAGPVWRVLRPAVDAVGSVFASVPGALVTGAVVLALVFAIALRLARRRVRHAALHGHGGHRRRREDPAALDRAATEAEAHGDFLAAVRLRYRAALIRLDAAGAITLRPSLTTGQVARTVSAPGVDELTAAFESIVYGGRPATSEDAQAARDGWPRVLTNVTGGRS